MTPDALWPVLAGPFAGSFAYLLVRRLPRGRPVAVARSACEHCGTVLKPLDLVPLLSALVLRGRCRRCGAPIAPGHWWMELAAAGVALCAVLAGGGTGRVWAGCGLGWTLLALAAIDAEHFRLPDVLTLPLLLAGLGVAAGTGDGPAHAAAAAFGFFLLRGLALGYRRWRGRDGLGAGDAKLFAAAGAWVGPEGLADVLLLAAGCTLLFALLLRWRGRAMTAGTALPFGPGLALASWIVWLAGPISAP